MGIMNFIRGEFIEIIEWLDDSRDTIVWRFPDQDHAIKRGAQLICRESQTAQFVYLGEFGDTFGPGKYSLTTDNIPILTRLKSWKYGLESPFKAEVYFVNTRLYTGNKWGTSNPIILRDQDFGIVRARAFGTYDFRVTDVKTFLKEVSGSDHDFRVDEFADTMRSRIVSIFSEALATAKVPVLDVATRYTELGEALLPLINPVISQKYGLEIASFIIENVSVPPEVEEAIDKRSAMSAIGNLNDFIKYQMAQGMGSGQGGGAAGMATEMAVGFGIAQEMMRNSGIAGAPPPIPGQVAQPAQQAAVPTPPATAPAGAAPSAASAGIPEFLTPEQVAQILGVTEQDVLAEVDSGNLQGKKIGASVRITRAALDAFLAQ